MEKTEIKQEGTPQGKTPKKKRKWLKPLIVIAVIVVVVAILFSRCMAQGQSLVGQAYIPVTAELRDMTVSVSGTGTIQPIDSYKVTALVKGEVLEAPFKVGDTVKKGDVLFRIDAGSVESSIRQQEISLAQAQLSLNNLLDNQGKNQQVKATATGVITTLYVEEGDTVAAGTPIADILDRTHMKITLPFHSADAAAFYVGQSAVVSVDGTAETLAATVDSVAGADSVGAGGTLVRNVTLVVTNPGVLTDTSTGTASVGEAACAGGGTFAYAESKQVVAKTSGELVSLTVKEGDQVTRDQVIASFDSADMTSQIESARLSVQSAELALQSARDSLDDYTITSPIDGVIIEMNYQVGDNLDPSTAGGYMAVVYDMTALEFRMDVHELDISKVAVGQEVEITASALGGETFTGRVDAININGTTLNGITNYPVTVTVDDGGDLLPGMNVSAKVIAQKVGNVLCVPVEAVAEGNQVTVAGEGALSEDGLTVADISKLSVAEVTLGGTDGTYVEILSGLSEGDVVVYAVQQSNIFMDMMAQAGG